MIVDMSLDQMLKDVVGSEYVSSEQFEIWCYTGEQHGETDVFVVRPGNNNEVLEIMKIANEKNVLVRPVGLRTVCTAHKPRKVRSELVGKKGIIIDMTRMNRIIEVSEETMTVTVEAGTTMAEINTALAPKGYRVIEGTLAPYCATAGALVGYGPGANKYGSRQDQVVDLEVATPTGTLLQTGTAGLGMPHFASEAPGLHLTGLFLEAGGSLGVITSVTLRIFPLPEYVDYANYEFQSRQRLLTFVLGLRREGVTNLPAMYEMYMWPSHTFMLLQHMPKTVHLNRDFEDLFERWPPFPSDAIGLVLEGTREQVDTQKKKIGGIAAKCGGEYVGLEPMRDHYANMNWDGNTKCHEDRHAIGTGWTEPHFLCTISQYPEAVEITATEAEEHGFKIGERYWRGSRVGITGITNSPCVMFDETSPEDTKNAELYYNHVLERVREMGGYAGYSPSLTALEGPTLELTNEIRRLIDPKRLMWS